MFKLANKSYMLLGTESDLYKLLFRRSLLYAGTFCSLEHLFIMMTKKTFHRIHNDDYIPILHRNNFIVE